MEMRMILTMKDKNIDCLKIVNIIILSFVIILLIILCSSISSTIADAYELDEKVHKFTLDNGLKVLIVERHFSPTMSLFIRYNVGAANESNEHTGTAHFLEHMLFKGTTTIGAKAFKKEKEILEEIRALIITLDREKKKGSSGDRQKIEDMEKKIEALQADGRQLFSENEIDRLYTEHGGADMNAYTGYDLTTYFVNLPSNKIELWARIESDRMINPVFRDFFSERNVVIEERKQTVESNPGRKLTELFLATAFLVHPYRRPIIGWASDMQFFDIDYTEKFFKTYHAPNNTVIAIVGDVNPSQIMKIIQEYFGRIPPGELPVSHISEDPVQRGERRVQLVWDANPEMIIGYHKPSLPSFDDYVFDLIDTILSRGRTSRLHQALIEKKNIATRIETANGFPGAKYPNLFVFFATPRYPHTNGDVEEAIYEELGNLQTRPVTENELEKAKNQLKTDFLRNLTSNKGLAGMLSYYEAITGDYRYISNHIKVIDSISATDVMNVAKKYLTPENRTVALLVKE